MIKIEIYEDTGTLIVNGPALDLLTEDEYQTLRDLGKALRRRLLCTSQSEMTQ